MPKHNRLVPHLSCQELEERYRQATDAVARSQYQILWLLAKGKRTEEVREVTGYSLRCPEHQQQDPVEQQLWKKNCHE